MHGRAGRAKEPELADPARALADAVGELVGDTRWWGRRRPRGRGPRPAVVEVRGDTAPEQVRAVLASLDRPGRVPFAMPVAGLAGQRRPESVRELLNSVATSYSLPRMVRRRRPLRFRRFRMAVAAYGIWLRYRGNFDDEGLDPIKSECEHALQQERGGLFEELRRLLRARQASGQMPTAAANVPGVVSMIAVALTVVPLVEWLVRHFWVNRPARGWFRRKLGKDTDDLMFRALGEVGRESVEVWDQWLVDAFLADIDAYYFWGRRLNRSRLPLLCLTDARDDTPGGELLRLLCSAQAGHRVVRRTSLVVVAWTVEENAGEVVLSADDVVQSARAGVGGPEYTVFRLPTGAAERPGRLPVPGHVSLACAFALVPGLVLGGTVWPVPQLTASLGCGQGFSLKPAVYDHDGQCIGVTDGSAGEEFMAELAQVSRYIEAENGRAEEGGPAVTVAFMMPMTPDNAPERRQVLREVQGAYLAQRMANRRGPLAMLTPGIRLVLANPGRDYAQWASVTDRLKEMTDDRYPLRAVTGFNISVRNTESALHALTDAGIPVVGGPITADEMENVREDGRQRFPGMARTVPTNSDQAAALVGFNKKATGTDDAALVVDRRLDDTYNSSLAQAFRKAVKPGTKAKEFESDGPTAEGNVANQFRSTIDSICYSRVGNVYFAGRPVHLRLFLLSLADRPCGGRKIRVITGSGASTVSLYLTDDDWQALRAAPWLSLQYSAAGHPEMWAEGDFGTGDADEAKARAFYAGPLRIEGGSSLTPGELTRQVQEEATGLGTALGTPVEWDDSRAMTGFDSVWLAANNIKSHDAGGGGGDADALPSLEDVSRQWANTYAGEGVPGMTGWMCLDNDGNPYNKTVAVVTLDVSRRSVSFQGISWPTDTPSTTCDVAAP